MSTTDLARREACSALGAPVDPLVEGARGYAVASRSAATRRAYRGQWRAFERFCVERRVGALPASGETVALYLTALAQAGVAPASIDQSLAAIADQHKLAGEPSPRKDPAVVHVRRGIRRTMGTAQASKTALLVPALRAVVTGLPPTIAGRRDRALLLLGFAGAFRRSELVSLDLKGLRLTEAGLQAWLLRSKTDQEGQGAWVAIPFGATPATCPVRAVRAWLLDRGLASGPLFVGVTRWGKQTEKRLLPGDVARIVKRAAQRVHLDAAELAGHSLRSGFATAAALAGKSERAIMRQTRHRTAEMVRRYIKEAQLFTDNAADGIGL
jgi:site-specific recombinase XerD